MNRKIFKKDFWLTLPTFGTGHQQRSSGHPSTGPISPAAHTLSTAYNNDELIRIVMVGKTGAGKSATGNTILGENFFKSDFSLTSLTKVCEKVYSEIDGQKVAVIDTPGLFDTRNTEEETIQNIAQSIVYASPGPHIFLIVIKLDRFTEEEKQTVQKIQIIFGKEANKYSMVLFTHGDLLKGKPINDLLKDNKDLKKLVAKCNGQYHVFDNQVKDRSQVSELLEKIRKINGQNGGSHYTTEMFQVAERAIEKEKQRILKEREEQNRKQQKETQDNSSRNVAENSYRVLRLIFSFVPVVTLLCNVFLSDTEDDDIDIDIDMA